VLGSAWGGPLPHGVWLPEVVSQVVARIPVLPRAIARAVTVSAVARGGWAIAAATLIVSSVGLSGLYARQGYAGDVTEPVIAMGIMAAMVVLLALRPSWPMLGAYILVGTICVVVFLYSVLSQHPDLQPEALILLNRPATALVLVGTIGSRPIPGLLLGVLGFFAGEAATLTVSVSLGVPALFGGGPVITLANYAAVYLGIALIQRAQRSRVPDFLRLRQETRRMDAVRTVEQRAVALLHDTVLNDLALVIHGPDTLDDRMRERMLLDVETLANTDLLADIDRRTITESNDGTLRNQLIALVSDFQWRGLSVEVTGDDGSVAHIDPEVIPAAIGALRACLENVLSHSGTDAAEIIVSVTETSISWTVSDAGRGFDPAAVDVDRLGLKTSVIGRVESVGGVVKIWSAPGNGTSILMTLPLRPPAAPELR
jgi:signal transduction histidine kinase